MPAYIIYLKISGSAYFKLTHDIYPDCMAGRQYREHFPKNFSHHASLVLGLIHIDLVGPLKVASHSE